MLKTIFFLAMLALAPAYCEAAEGGEVLWWLIGTNYESIKGETAQGTTMTAEQLGVNGARVRYDSDSGSGYLTLYALDSDDNFVQYDGVGGVKLAAECYASLDGLGGLSATSCSFVIELGSWDNGQWLGTSMESTDLSGYAVLAAANHIAAWKDLDSPYSQPWTPTEFRVVPEPNSALMLLVGGALLALRRKRRNG